MTDLTSEIENVENRLFARLQTKWRQDSIDNLVDEQKKKDAKFARESANRILRQEYDEDDEDEDGEDDEDDEDDEEIVADRHGKYIPKKKRPVPRHFKLKRKPRTAARMDG